MTRWACTYSMASASCAATRTCWSSGSARPRPAAPGPATLPVPESAPCSSCESCTPRASSMSRQNQPTYARARSKLRSCIRRISAGAGVDARRAAWSPALSKPTAHARKVGVLGPAAHLGRHAEQAGDVGVCQRAENLALADKVRTVLRAHRLLELLHGARDLPASGRVSATAGTPALLSAEHPASTRRVGAGCVAAQTFQAPRDTVAKVPSPSCDCARRAPCERQRLTARPNTARLSQTARPAVASSWNAGSHGAECAASGGARRHAARALSGARACMATCSLGTRTVTKPSRGSPSLPDPRARLSIDRDAGTGGQPSARWQRAHGLWRRGMQRHSAWDEAAQA